MANNFVNYSNATQLMQAIADKFNTLAGAYIFKGNKTFAELPETLTSAMVGYTYNITEEFTTDERFIEGAGKVYPAGTNVSIADISSTDTPDLMFDVIGNFVDVDAIMSSIQDVSDMITGEFDETSNYAIGDYVVYEGDLYRFDVTHTAGAWDDTQVTQVTVVEIIGGIDGNLKALINSVAHMIQGEFDATQAYEIGDVVTYNASLYRFTSAHAAGAWNSSEVSAITVIDYIDEKEAALISRIDNVVSSLAPEFDAATAYSTGDLVMYNDLLYIFTADHAAGAWTGSDASRETASNYIKTADAALSANIVAISNSVTADFSSDAAYAVGDYVMYNKRLYVFTSAHAAGAWDASQVETVQLIDLIEAAEPESLTTAQVNALLALLD